MHFKSQLIGWKVLEIIAVLCNLTFTLLFLKNHPLSFFFGIIGPLLLIPLSYNKRLFADVVLQLIYALLACFGWWFSEQALPAWNISLREHIIWIGVSATFSGLMGWSFKKWSSAALPYLDAQLTGFSISATWMLMHQCSDAWLYFIGINALGIGLFLKRNLYGVALLYFFYILLAIAGWLNIQFP